MTCDPRTFEDLPVIYDPLVGSFSTYCAHCDSKVHADQVFPPERTNSETWHTFFGLCPGCSGGIMQFIDGRVFPPPTPGIRDIENMPDDLAAAWQECRLTFAVNAFTSAEVMCRKILMHVAVDQFGLAEGLTFVQYVDALEEHGHVSPALRPAIDKVRVRGNFAAHQLPASSREDAARTLRITHHLLSGTYEIAAL